MFEQQIRELAAREETEAPFFSFYLDTNWVDEAQRDRLRVVLKDEFRRLREEVGGNGNDAMIDRISRRIEQYIDHTLESSTRGVAIFACPADDFFLTIQLPVPVEDRVEVGSRPHLKPLAELRQLHPLVAIAMVDAKSARLFELEFSQILHEIDLEHPDMPRRHDQGGWSQANMQRHVQDHIDRHHKEVAEVLTRMVDQGRVSSVILSGQERNLANFRTFLPKRIEGRILGSLHLDIRSSGVDVVAQVQELLSAHRASTVDDRLQMLEAIAQKKQRGALGFEPVIEAVNQRKIEQLFLEKNTRSRGWKCSNCTIIGRNVPLGCPVCGNAVRTIDLVEELISASTRENAAIEFVPDASALDRYEGVGALLRF